ncbi:hypothetical protein ONZ51_g9012 [Trametes cubensis]|uniref:BTB domain-containing protein n=1 Tax=Trametes cubensis TaxID=1111947 RepID=A0AAD7TMI6_9APHY|nr:hypothetical protein ONZ51_g9012 [Trametes cubensis]
MSTTSSTPPIPNLTNVTRDNDFWFDDGNVVIITTNLRTYSNLCPTAFRIHRSVLARHVRAPEDLLLADLHIGDPLTDTMDGCPMFRLPDSSHDFRCVLHAIYDGPNYSEAGKPLPFSTAAALVRLGHKYDIDSARDLGMKRLDSVFGKCSTWNLAINRSAPVSERSWSTEVLSLRRKDPIIAVNLFRTINAQDKLLAALYMCTELDNDDLLTGTTRVDGLAEKLSANDLARCLDARDRLAARCTTYIVDTLTLPSRTDCRKKKTCDQRLKEIKPLMLTQERHQSFGATRCGIVGPIYPQWSQDTKLCETCRVFLSDRELDFQKTLWRALPSIMDMTGVEWDNLFSGTYTSKMWKASHMLFYNFYVS